MIFRWTDEMDAILRQKHGEGYSFSQIAQAINDKARHGITTRNACIGRANRIGLVSANVTKKPATQMPVLVVGDKITFAGDPVVYVVKPIKPRKARPKVAPHPFPPRAKPIEAQVAEIVFAPGPEGIRFFEQRDGACRWPLTVETDFENFRVCGCLCKLTQPYCDEHTAKAYQARQPRPPREPAPMRRNTSEMYFKDWA